MRSGKHLFLPPLKYQPCPYITVIQRKSLTDRYIQPQLPAFALDALFICVPIWRNPPNLPTSTEKRSSKQGRETRREGGRETEREESQGECQKKRKKQKERGEGRRKHQNKRMSETDTEKWERERLSLSAAMW